MLDDSSAYARGLTRRLTLFATEKRDTLDPIGDVTDAAHFHWDAPPKGSRLEVTAAFDNSPNNKFNPDPNQTVYYGDMTWEEMMFPFFSVTVDQSQQTRKVIKIVKGRDGDGA